MAPPIWGEARDGLRLSLSFPETRWKGDAPPVATIRAQNTGPLALRLLSFEEENWVYHVHFEGLDGVASFQGGAGFFIEYAEPQNARLASGAIWQRTVDLRAEARRFLRLIENRKPGDDWDYRDALPPGRYRATIEYRSEAGRGEGFWVGTVRSNAVAITVEP